MAEQSSGRQRAATYAYSSTTSSHEESTPDMQDLGKKSSIGNVKTLRSKLHSRRATLNKEIEKEHHFLKGSKKLVGATLNHKTRDQAALELNFAESKVKALQTELAKINSSLSAYQAENVQDSQVPLIPLALKTTAKVNFVVPFSEIIGKHYHTDPVAFQDSLYELQELRYSISDVTRDEAGVELMIEYYNQIQLVSKRFLHSQLKHGIAFVWYDAISGMPAAQQNPIFEKACVLFNIGALYTQLAAKVDRSSKEAIDTAVEHLERAIGVFEYMKEKFSNSPMMDMSREVLPMFSDLMRAQAQELVWEKVVLDGLSDDINSLIDYSHRTKSIAECLRPIRELTDDDNIKEYLPDCWVTLIKVKEAHYKALAHYYAAEVHRNLADMYSSGGVLPEELRTELHFLYTNIDSSPEILTNHPKCHVGLVHSHLNCATLSHEYSVKYNSLCRDLHHITPLTKMLAEAEERSKQRKQEADKMEGVTVIAPAIQPSEVRLTAILPDFNSVAVKDMFRSLGPLPAFSAENSWSAPRSVTIKRGKEGLGLSVKGSKPVKISEVDKDGAAELAGVKEKDWLLVVNGVNVMYKSHDDVVAIVKECEEEVTFELVTPQQTNET